MFQLPRTLNPDLWILSVRRNKQCGCPNSQLFILRFIHAHETVVEMSSLFSESAAMSDKWNGLQKQNVLVRIVESTQNGSMGGNDGTNFIGLLLLTMKQWVFCSCSVLALVRGHTDLGIKDKRTMYIQTYSSRQALFKASKLH